MAEEKLNSNKVLRLKTIVCCITEFIIGLKEPDVGKKKNKNIKKPNSQISAGLAVGRKILYTYIKLICLRSH